MNERKTILFDLDGTLLPMDIKVFEKMYFQGLCKCMAGQIDPSELIKHIWGGTKAMVLNDGKKTNMEVFADYFNTHTPLDYDTCEPVFMKFYETNFQDCVKACAVTDLSKQIVETLRNKEYTVAIATNPIFPSIATYSRLNWLGLDPKSFPLVTTFENSHSAKPNPAYYLEVCDKLGVKPEQCIMIGNDVKEDGVAASLGMEVILVKDCLLNDSNLPTDSFELKTLSEVLIWAQSL